MSDSALPRLKAAIADRYRLERELGAGGMATVYLAYDLKHERNVAVKVLKPELAAVLGAERFVVEIRTTASLSHPHILPLFDSGTADGFLFYVMPYVEGETLREKLNRETQLGVDEAVKMTVDIADALDYAHRHGVIHRDIKPENILLHDGRPMVADFGIALAVSAAAGGRMTETGLSLGTPHYMSPEQATAEKEITARSDVYSLASVLYEMLTGNPPHTGASAQQIIMKIITESAEPVTKYRKSVSPQVAATLAKALEKLPADRFQSAAEFGGALAGRVAVVTQLSTAGVPANVRASVGRRVIGTATAVAVVMLGLGWAIGRIGTAASPLEEPLTFTIPTAGEVYAYGFGLTPDGRTLLYGGPDSANGVSILSRDLGSLTTKPVRATRDAMLAGYSADGRALIIVSAEGTRLVPLDGSPITELGGPTFNQAQLADGRYVVARDVGEGLFLRATASDTLVPLTQPDTARQELAHWTPVALPSGKAVLFTSFSTPTQSGVEVLEIASGKRTRLAGDGAMAPRYSTTGHVLFWRRGTVYAIPFDAKRLRATGPEVAVLEDVAADPSGAVGYYHLATNGTLAYLRRSEYDAMARVSFADRTGRETPTSIRDADIRDITLSHDGRRAALVIAGPIQDIWVHDFARGSTVRLTTAKAAAFAPIWSPDGRYIYYTNESPSWDIWRVPADGSGAPESVFSSSPDKAPLSVGPDGSLWFRENKGVNATIRVMNPESREEPRTFAQFFATDLHGRLSPDGRWFTYSAVSSPTVTRADVYVVRADGSGRQQLSSAGGRAPRFTRDGREIIYFTGDSVVSVGFNSESGRAELPRLLYRQSAPREVRSRTFSLEGEQSLVVRTVQRPSASPITVVVHWHTELLRRMQQR